MNLPRNYFARLATTGGQTSLHELAVPFYGSVESVKIKQVSGTNAAASVNLLTRRGASSKAADIDVNSGALTSVTNNGSGKCRVTVTAGPHSHIAGQILRLKDTSVAGYNRLHTVTAKISDTVFDTDINYSADASGGWWQEEPLLSDGSSRQPLLDPAMYRVLATIAVTSGTLYEQYGLQRHYANADLRPAYHAQQSRLYLEITPEGSGAKEYDLHLLILETQSP